MEILMRRKHNLMTEEEWRALCGLETHLDDFKKSSNYGEIRLMAMGAHRFSMAQDRFSIDFVEAMFSRVCNISRFLHQTNYVLGSFELSDLDHAHTRSAWDNRGW